MPLALITPLSLAATRVSPLGIATGSAESLYNIRDYGAQPGQNITAATNAAIAAASAAGGGIVYFPSTLGVCQITNPVFWDNLTNISFAGDGAGRSIIEFADHASAGVWIDNCSGLNLAGLTFQHNATFVARNAVHNVRINACTDVTVSGCEFKYAGDMGLIFISTNNVTCEYNYVHETRADGIHCVIPLGDVRILKNHVELTGDDAIAVWNYGASPSAAGTYSINVANNRIKTANLGAGVGGYGIRVGGLDDFIIANNNIRDTAFSGINVLTSTWAAVGGVPICRNGVIEGNTIINTNQWSGFAGLDIVNTDSANSAFVLTAAHENLTVNGNTIDNAGNYGMLLLGVKNLAAHGNTVLNSNASGGGSNQSMRIAAIDRGNVSGNSLSETRGSPLTQEGIWVSDTTDLILGPNEMRGMVKPYPLATSTNTRLYAEITLVGTPEAVVTLPPPAVCHNLSGGAGTSLYVKESNTTANGWVGK